MNKQLKDDEPIYNNYDCIYCGHKFEARSGKVKKTKGGALMILKNTVECERCRNFLRNKAED